MAQNDNIRRKQEILAAAERVFEASGYSATTMDAVAAEAGISKGSIYNYFSSKQELFHQIFAQATSEAEQRSVEVLSKPAPASERIAGILEHWFSRLGYHKRIGKLFLEFWASAAWQQQGDIGTHIASAYATWRGRLADLISEGVRDGEFRQDVDPVVAASLLMAILDGIQVQSILDLGLTVDEDFLTALRRAILVALTGRADAGQPDER